MNASEVLDGLAALPGARDSGGDGDGIIASRLLNGIEYARVSAVEEPKLRSSWKRRQGGGATPLVLVADDPEQQGFVRVLGPQRDGPMRAGLEQEAELLRKEIARLRSLVSRAAYDLKDAGADRKARTLVRALEGR